MTSFDDDGDNGWTGGDDTVGVPGAPAPVFDLAALADALPRLGSVLWLEHRGAAGFGGPCATSAGIVLFDHPALAPLARCTNARACQAITPAGPREWLEFRSAAAEPLAKLFLLPDTDYLAWDEMTARCGLAAVAPPASRWSAHAAFLRGALARLGATWRAHVFAFDLQRMPWLRTLDARTPLRLSLLGVELARAIAREHGINSHTRFSDHAAGCDDWRRTSGFWAAVRARWAARETAGIASATRPDTDREPHIEALFRLADRAAAGETIAPADIDALFARHATSP